MNQGTRIWINVTTSANWSRPAVGIVRVERALVEHLQRQLGTDVCKLCIWRDDRFVEWVPPSAELSTRVSRAVDTLLPRGPAFDVARPFVLRAFEKFSRTSRDPGESSDELHINLPLSDSAPLQPAPDDFLLSVGLDWEHPFTQLFHELAKKQGLRIITCCYDLIPVLFPQYCVGEVAQRFTEYFLDLSWGSEALVCISEQTRRDYIRLCDELGAPARKAVVIPLGDNLPSGDTQIGEQVRAVSENPYILFVSTIERRKNHEVLYRAYHLLLRKDSSAILPKLVFVGMQGWGVGDLMKDIELDPLTKGLVIQLHQVSDAELAFLYRHALFCVFPSLYEGWGLPVGEALAMGKLVISSGEGSLPEVGGDLVHYLPAWNAYDWADTIRDYVDHPEKIRDAEARVRSLYKPRQWSDTAKTVHKLIVELAAKEHAGAFDLYPGYDLSTLCGMHSGASIKTTGLGGLLLFGPHRALRKGGYELRLRGSVLDSYAGSIFLEVASNGGHKRHFAQSYDLSQNGASIAIDLSFALEQDVNDFEIKCEIPKSAALRFDKITVAPA